MIIQMDLVLIQSIIGYTVLCPCYMILHASSKKSIIAKISVVGMVEVDAVLCYSELNSPLCSKMVFTRDFSYLEHIWVQKEVQGLC